MRQQSRNVNYSQQIERLSTRIKQLDSVSDRIANWRALVVFGGGIPSFILLFTNFTWLFALTLISTIVGFIGLVVIHRRVEKSIARHKVWRSMKQEHHARQTLDWQHIPETTIEAALHPLEIDLDLRHLLRLLNTATSHNGTHRLRSWLINSAPNFQVIQQRQALVQEIISRPTFRDKLILAARLSSATVRKPLDARMLRGWLETDVEEGKVNRALWILGILAALNFALFGLSQFGLFPSGWSSAVWVIYALYYISRAGLIGSLTADGQQIADALTRLQAVMRHLESYSYEKTPHLRKLCQPLLEERPSGHIRQLLRTLAASNLRGNPLLWITLNAIVPWDLFFLRRLQQQKQILAESIPQWLDVWHEIEALNSLGNHAYLNPDTTVPHLYLSENDTIFEAKSIGHPLIPQQQRVTNTFRFNKLGDVVIITGSNMAGKSSFLRTLGVNLVLAYAGGTVHADKLSARVFRLFTCIRVTDSLDDGISYFYAEVKRLRDLLDALQANYDIPLFYVIDEIFRGTNNRERLIGSQSYIQALVNQQGVGLIATHDLELTQLADGNPHIRNLHFREHVDEGRMVFDYILREGSSPTTNALTIMTMEGLPVHIEDETENEQEAAEEVQEIQQEVKKSENNSKNGKTIIKIQDDSQT